MHKHETTNNRLDGIAILLSGVCMLHCLALPVIITLFPIAQGNLLDEQSFHLMILVFILPTSLIALSVGCRKHKDKLTLILGAIGLVVLTFTAIFGHEAFGLDGERIVTTVGGLILAAAHLQNFRMCRSDNCDHH